MHHHSAAGRRKARGHTDWMRRRAADSNSSIRCVAIHPLPVFGIRLWVLVQQVAKQHHPVASPFRLFGREGGQVYEF